jgi:class 3 adenylate cyclase/predicted ATPase
VPTCAGCGYEAAETFRVCPECGTGAVSPASAQRKVVTVLFCDVVGSTALGESTDPEPLRALLARYFEGMKAIVERHGGTVEKFIGDAIMAVFGVPLAHEDDALRACRAALEMRAALPALEIDGRIGVATGEVVTGTAERLATGDAVNLAARLQQTAQPGEILIAEGTQALVGAATELEAIEPLALKGKAKPVPAFRLCAVHEVERRPETPFVGREQELLKIHAAWERVLSDRRCELLTIVGEAGVGKSRLVAEALASLEGRLVEGRCLPYGEGITYWPVVEVLKQLDALPADEAAATAMRSLLGETDLTSSAEEIAWAFRKLLEEQAPLIAVFDDIQWGEETFLNLLEHVALLSSGAPILLLAMARTELTERRAEWPVILRLEPLGRDEVEKLIPERISDELRVKIAQTAGGNPLFVEEMVSMAGEARAEVVVPPTLKALLVARLDQLDADERKVLQYGAVEGEVFHRGSVQALAEEESQVTPWLASLVRKGLIRPEKAQLTGEDGFRFRHLLIRGATYAGIPKATRAELHQRFATWLERRNSDLVELEEILGYHLEQAYRYLEELGPLDTQGRGLGVRGAVRLASAGSRAFARGDMPAAANLLRRAVDLVEQENPRRLELVPNLGEALLEIGEFAQAQLYLDEAVESACARGESTLAAKARLVRALVQAHVQADIASENIVREAGRSVPIFERREDHDGLATAFRLLAWAFGTAGDLGAAAGAAERAVAEAVLAGDERQRSRAASAYALAAFHGPTPVGEAIAQCEAIIERADGDRRAEGLVTSLLAGLEAMRGNFDRARELSRSARAVLEDLGEDVLASSTSLEFSVVALLANDAPAAEEHLRRDFSALMEIGEKYTLSTIAGELARAVYAQDRLDEALALSATAEEMSAEDDIGSQVLWRSARARVLARRGENGEAERLAREAVVLGEGTDMLNLQGSVYADLAEVLALAGSPEGAVEALEHALARYQRKENIVMVERLRGRLAEMKSSLRAGERA